MSNSARFFLFALIAGCLVRAGLAWLVLSDPAVLTHSDQSSYLALADVLAAGRGFGTAFGTERMPGYPVFLYLCRAVTGSALAGPLALQNVCGMAAVWACWKIGDFYGRDTANLAGGFAALNLNMAVYANQMLTESIYLPVFAWALYLLFAYARRGGMARLAGLALVLGLSVLIRSVGMYLPLFMVPWLVLRGGVAGVKKGLTAALIFVLAFGAGAAPWLVRNQMVYGNWGLTTQGEPHLIGWVVPSVARFEDGLDQDAAVARYTAIWRVKKARLGLDVEASPFAVSDAAKDFARDYLLSASPISIAKAWFWGAARNILAPVGVELAYILQMDWSHFSETPGTGAVEQLYNFLVHNKNPVYSALLGLGLFLTLAFRLAQLGGMAVLVRRDRAVLWAGLLVVAYFLAVSGPVGYAKYRLPYEPFFVLLTALAASRLPWFKSPGAGEGGGEA